jgi:hypothetical protein
MGQWWNDVDGKTKELEEKPVPVPLVHINPTWTAQDMNPGLLGVNTR